MTSVISNLVREDFVNESGNLLNEWRNMILISRCGAAALAAICFIDTHMGKEEN